MKNALYTVKMTEFLEENLPNIPVISALGNHEFYPVNVMEIDSTDPVIKSLAKVWSNYLDDEALAMFKKYGYYSQKVLLDDPSWSDVRVISLNSEQCNEMNWYLWSALGDPNNEIAWFESELKKAEAANEKVLLIAHFPSMSCNHAFGARFQALVERYQHLIRL